MVRTSISGLVSAVLSIWVLSSTVLILPVSAQTTGASAFQWAFAFNMVSNTVSACQNYSISVSSRNPNNASAIGVPPYYMMAFVPSGIPTTSYIGSNPSNLTWQVNLPNGTNIILAVADSVGNSGGNSVNLFTVSGDDTACTSSQPSRTFYLDTNITGTTLETCDNLGLRVYGGTKPYNLSFSALNSPVITNVTLGPTDDVFTWPNRADPNGEILVAVSDVNGWGTSTKLFNTKGSSNVTCPGLRSTSGNSSTVNQHPAPPPKPVNRGLIAGVVVAGCVLLLLLGLGAFLWQRRKRLMQEQEPAYLPDAWTWPANQISIHANEGEQAGGEFSPYHDQPNLRESKLSRERQWMGANARPGSSSSYGYHGRNESGSIGMALLHSEGSSGSASGSGGPTTRRGKERNTSHLPDISQDWNGEHAIIIQHEDAGDLVPVVQEVPPPYKGPAAPVASGAGEGPSDASIHEKELPLPPAPSVPPTGPSAEPIPGSSSSGFGADAGQFRYPGLGGV